MKKLYLLFTLLGVLMLHSSCYKWRMSKGGGQIGRIPARETDVKDVAVPPGYSVEVVTQGLTFPSSVTFDDQGRLYVIEAGYSYGEVWLEPKLLRMEADGTFTTLVTGSKNGPWTSLIYYEGYLYLSEGGQAEGGKIFRVSLDGTMKELVSGLPSLGDHHTDGIVIKDNYIYFGQGTATNSGVVGKDNMEFGWLMRHKDFHDIPCRDIILAGRNYESENIFTEDPKDKIMTGAFVPFGTSTTQGQVIKGKTPCTGSIMRIPLEGGQPEMVAWGLRNPYGLALAPNGDIYISENGYDDRGSRPIWGTGDVLYKLQPGMWYGYPDFSAGVNMADKEGFKVPGKDFVKPVMQNYPNTPPKPTAIFGVHSSANGMDFATNQSFGHTGEVFVAEFGDMAPNVGKVLAPVGFKVVRVNTETGVIEDFAVNKGKKHGPASRLKKKGLERPLAVKFSPKGDALYIVDFGILKMGEHGPEPQQGTGVIWKITKK